MNKENTVRKWIETLPMRGRLTFSMNEVEEQFSMMPKSAIRSSIYRLVAKGRVCSVWRGFYVIVPDEYGLRGVVPPIEYVDYLINYLGFEYYIGLLSAAQIHGAGHQQPQALNIIINSKNVKDKITDDIAIHFSCKKNILKQYLIEKNVGYGKIKLSSPELTALDLIAYESSIGGLERAAMVIDELSEQLDFTSVSYDFWAGFANPVIQRFGYISELLGLAEVSDAVYEQVQYAGIKFRKTLLDPTNKNKNPKYNYSEKWKLSINTELEILS
jgi:predicted transcriptional regulator of viral defense system